MWQLQENLNIERDKSFRHFMLFGSVMAGTLSVVPLWAIQDNSVTAHVEQLLMFGFWEFVATLAFVQAGANTLSVHFASRKLEYTFGSPLTQRKFVGTCADISHLALTRQQLTRAEVSTCLLYTGAEMTFPQCRLRTTLMQMRLISKWRHLRYGSTCRRKASSFSLELIRSWNCIRSKDRV